MSHVTGIFTQEILQSLFDAFGLNFCQEMINTFKNSQKNNNNNIDDLMTSSYTFCNNVTDVPLNANYGWTVPLLGTRPLFVWIDAPVE